MSEQSRIWLVTGAAGFLGGEICRQLTARGERVRAFVLPGDPAEKYIPEEVEKVEGDLTDTSSLEPFFRIPEGFQAYVLHIASIVTVNPDYNRKVMEVNVGGTKNILHLCLTHHVEKLVYCSSTGAIPELPKGQAIRETDHFDDMSVLGCYSQSKALATQAVLDAVKYEGLNASVVHPSGILGPGDFAEGETTRTLIRIINGEMPAGIDGSFNLSDVRDLAAGTIAAAEKGRKGECYILANEEVTFREFTRLISEESGCKKIPFFLPVRAAYTIGRYMEKRARRKGEKPLMTSFSIYNLDRNNRYDSRKAKRELGYTTRSYRETIQDEIQWLKDAGKIRQDGCADGQERTDIRTA